MQYQRRHQISHRAPGYEEHVAQQHPHPDPRNMGGTRADQCSGSGRKADQIEVCH